MSKRDSCVIVRPRVVESPILKIGSDKKKLWSVIQPSIHTSRWIRIVANTRLRYFALYKQRLSIALQPITVNEIPVIAELRVCLMKQL